MNPAEQFKINLNQNLWGLLLAFSFLGAAEYYKLCILFWFAAVASGTMLLSVIITTAAYTFRYCKDKWSS